MLAQKYLLRNKKTTAAIILSITLATILLVTVSLIFSSIRNYMINEVKIEEGSYHVSLTADHIIHSRLKKVVKTKNHFKIEYKEVENTYKYTKEICNKVKCKNIKYNTKLLSLYGTSDDKNTSQTIKLLFIITITILGLIASVLIYNTFAINVQSKKKQVSVLKSIGMTKFQIIKMFLDEGVLITLIALPVGVIVSFWFTQILLTVINYLLKGILNYTLTISVYPIFIIISILYLTIITFISCLLPAIKISKISIIEGIKENKKYKVKKMNKSLKTKLAYYNYQRNKKQYRPVILGVFISVTMYIIFSLYLNYGLTSLSIYEKPKYNYQITTNKEIKNFSKGKTYKMCIIKQLMAKENFLNEKYYYKNKNLIVIESSKNYVINEFINQKKEKKKFLKKQVIVNDQKVSTKKKTPLGLENYQQIENTIYLTNQFEQYCQEYVMMKFITENIPNFESKIAKLAKKNDIKITYVNYQKAYKLANNLILAIKLTLYSLIGLMILIGTTTIINVIHSSLNQRTKDLATLKSIGTDKKQLNEMLMKETYYILRKAFVVTVPIILLIDVILWISINQAIKTNFIFPYERMIISFLISFLIIFITLKRSIRILNNKNLIDMIQNENN